MTNHLLLIQRRCQEETNYLVLTLLSSKHTNRDLATMSETIPPVSSDILELLRANMHATLHIMEPANREGLRHEELGHALSVFKTTADTAWSCAERGVINARSDNERARRGDIAAGGEVNVGRGVEVERIRAERERIAAETERLKVETEKIKAETERAWAEKERLVVEVQRVNGEIEFRRVYQA